MILSKAYDEIMDRIVVNDDMRQDESFKMWEKSLQIT